MNGTFGWMFTTWLSLIALQALTSPGAPARVSQAFAGANHLLERALDPTVPAIPDRSASGTSQPATAVPSVATTTTPTTIGTRSYA